MGIFLGEMTNIAFFCLLTIPGFAGKFEKTLRVDPEIYLIWCFWDYFGSFFYFLDPAKRGPMKSPLRFATLTGKSGKPGKRHPFFTLNWKGWK